MFKIPPHKQPAKAISLDRTFIFQTLNKGLVWEEPPEIAEKKEATEKVPSFEAIQTQKNLNVYLNNMILPKK